MIKNVSGKNREKRGQKQILFVFGSLIVGLVLYMFKALSPW